MKIKKAVHCYENKYTAFLCSNQLEFEILRIEFKTYFTAIILISTFTNLGRLATSTVSLAGAVSELKCFP